MRESSIGVLIGIPKKYIKNPLSESTFQSRSVLTVPLCGSAARRLRRVRFSAVATAYFTTFARTAQARAVNEIDPSAVDGRRSRMRSRKRALAVSPSAMA
jgi:hypothetical protein